MSIQPTGNVLQSGPSPLDNVSREAPPVALAKPSVEAVAAARNAVQQPEPPPPLEKVTQALQSINKTMASLSRGLEFTMDDTDRAIVKVVDQETKEVIRQIPSKETLEIASALDKVQGLLIRQKA